MGQKEQIAQDKEEFLELLEEYHGNVRRAGAGIGRKRPHEFVYYHRKKDPQFAERFDEIKEEQRNLLLDRCEDLLFKKVFIDEKDHMLLFMMKCIGKDRGWIEYKEFEGNAGKVIIEIQREDLLDGQESKVCVEAAEDVSEATRNLQ